MGRLEHDLSLSNLLAEVKQWTLAAKDSWKWLRRLIEVAERDMKRWFDTEGTSNTSNTTRA